MTGVLHPKRRDPDAGARPVVMVLVLGAWLPGVAAADEGRFGGPALLEIVRDHPIVALALVLLGIGTAAGLGMVLRLRRQVAARTRDLGQVDDTLAQQRAAMRRSEAALTASQEQLHLALESAQAGTWHWNLETNANTWSDEVRRLYGLDPSVAASYEAWKGSIDERDVAAAEAAIASAVSERRGFEVSWRVRGWPAEQPRWLLSRGQPQFDAAGGVTHYLGIVIDISERMKAEETNELFLRAFFDSPAGKLVSRVDDGRIVEVNEALCRMLDFRREDLIGHLTTEFGVWAGAEDRAAMLAQLRSGRAVPRYEMQIRSRQGPLVDVQLSLHASVYRGVTCAFASLIDVTALKQAEEERRSMLTRLQLATEASNAGVWVLDLRSGRRTWDRRMCEIYQAPPKVVEHGPDEAFWRSRCHPDDRPRVEQAVASALRAESNYAQEYRIVLPDGSVRHIQSAGVVERNDAGHAIRVIGINRDVTMQVERERALRYSEARLRTLIDTLPDLVWLKDPAGVFLTCNRRFAQLYGRHESEIVGRTDHDLVDAALATHFRAGDQEAVDAIVPPVNEDEVTFASDGHRELLQTIKVAVRDDEGRPVGVLGVARDISALRRNEEELRAHRLHLESLVDERAHELAVERRRLHQILEATRAGTWEWNVQTGKATFNERWAQMIGYALTELGTDGRSTWSALVHPEDLPRCVDAVERHLRGELPYYDAEHRMRHKAGHWVWVLASGRVASRTEDGRPLLMSGTHLDITRRKTAELALQEAKEAAEAAAKAKSGFLANMSHEIRTPLNGVLGMAQIGFRDSFGRGKTQATFSRILDSGRLLLTIVNDILDFSKIEAGKLEVESVPLDPARVADEVMQGLAELASAKSLPLVAEKEVLPPAVLGDPVRIAQILYNLLSNAVKFTERGEVRLSVRVERGTGGEALVFAVRDTGIGIDDKVLARLFQPFEQADGSFTRRYGGTGLGLAISRRLASLMGGALEVDSTPGQGSVFTLRLPLRATDQPAPQHPHPAAAGAQRLSGMYLLVAEDNAVNQIVMDELLRGEGAEVVHVDNGRQAVERVARSNRPFDAVLMDVQMPVMDGLEATRALVHTHPSLPVIGQTAHALKEEADRCLAAGMVATVQKPVDLELLVSTLLERVGRARREPALAEPARTEAALTGRPAVDWPAFRRRYASRPAFVQRLSRLFVEGHAADPQRLRLLVAAQDLAAIEQVAHELKGTAGNVFATDVERLASLTLEHARQRGPAAFDRANELAMALSHALGALDIVARGAADSPPGAAEIHHRGAG